MSKPTLNPSSKYTTEFVDLCLQSIANPTGDRKAVLLYGQFQKKLTEDNTRYYYALPNAVEFNVSIDERRRETDTLKEVSVNQIKKMLGATKIAFRRGHNGTLGEFKPPMYAEALAEQKNQIPLSVRNARYFVFKSDFPKLFDAYISATDDRIGFQLIQGPDKQRNLHKCKECNIYYRNYCSCTSHYRLGSYGHTSDIKFFDVKDEQAYISNGSINMQNKAHLRRAFIGVEIEMNMENRSKARNEQNLQILRFAKKQGLPFVRCFNEFKSDSTLTNGVELVTQPFSSDFYAKYRKGFEELSTTISAMNITGHNDNTAGDNIGLHMHISRDAFHNGMHLFRFLKLVHQSPDQLDILSNRNGRYYSDIQPHRSLMSDSSIKKQDVARQLGFKKSQGILSDADVKKLAKRVMNGERVESRNWMNYSVNNTIEYRLPASIFDNQETGKGKQTHNRFASNMELVFSMYEYTIHANNDDVSFSDYITWLKGANQFHNILQQIKESDELLSLTFGVGEIVSGQKAGGDLTKAVEDLAELNTSLIDNPITLSNLSALQGMMERANSVVKSVTGNALLDPKQVSKKVDAFKSKKQNKKGVK